MYLTTEEKWEARCVALNNYLACALPLNLYNMITEGLHNLHFRFRKKLISANFKYVDYGMVDANSLTDIQAFLVCDFDTFFDSLIWTKEFEDWYTPIFKEQ